MHTDYNTYIQVKASSHINRFKQTVNDERSFMQIKWTSGQLKIMTLCSCVYCWEVCLVWGGYEGSDQEIASF